MPTVESCTFTGNSAGNGGAMLNYQSAPTLTNCLFSANFTTYGDGRGGAIFNMASTTILNCTFYKNGWRLFTSGPEPRYRPYTLQRRRHLHIPYRRHHHELHLQRQRRQQGRRRPLLQRRPGGELTNCLFYENIAWWPNS